MRSKKIYGFLALLFGAMLACTGGEQAAQEIAPPTRTALPTFTNTPTPAPPPTVTPAPVQVDPPTPVPATNTPLPPPTAIPTDPPAATFTPSPPPTNTLPPPTPTDTPTITPTPEPIIKYVLAGTQREFNCDHTAIYGAVLNANNFAVPDVEVRALGVHGTSLEFSATTDAEGRYEIFRIPLSDLQAGQWAVMVMEDGREVSERFHWASTPVCQSEDTGHSQVLRVDWKLIE